VKTLGRPEPPPESGRQEGSEKPPGLILTKALL
jgi:hypothetical protein